MTVTFTVYGLPRPAGSKKGFVINGRAVLADDNEKSRSWKTEVKDAARAAYDGAPLTGPLYLAVTYCLPRPKGHYGSGKNAATVKASAPAEHTQKPDVTKLTRAVEDALKGVLYRDDSQIYAQKIRKTWTTGPACAQVILVERVGNPHQGGHHDG